MVVQPLEPDSPAFHGGNAFHNISDVKGYAEILPVVFDVENVVGVAQFRVSGFEFDAVFAYIEFDVPVADIGH